MNCAILFILAYNLRPPLSPSLFFLFSGVTAVSFSVVLSAIILSFLAENPLFSAFLGVWLLLMALLRATKKEP